MSIHEARENVLWNFVNNNPNGNKKLATAAISALPYSSLKILVEALELEEEVKKEKKQ